MHKDIPMTEARHELTSLPERLAKEPGAIAVTRRGKPVLAVMPWDLYESNCRDSRDHGGRGSDGGLTAGN